MLITNDSGPKLPPFSSSYRASNLQDFQQRAQRLNPNVGVQQHETVMELTYRLALLTSALYVQPDLQYVFWPGGTGRISDALVLGAQLGVNF